MMKRLSTSIILCFQFAFAFAQVTAGSATKTNVKIPTYNTSRDALLSKHKDAQNLILDSLNGLLKNSKEDTTQFNLLKEIWNTTFSGAHNDSVLFVYGNKMLTLANKIDYEKGKGIAYFILGTSYDHVSKGDSAMIYFNDAIISSQKAKDIPNAIKIYSKMSTVYKDRSDYAHAIEMTLKSLKFAEEIGQTKGIANAYNSLGNIYGHQKNYKKSITCHKKSLELRISLKDKRSMSYSYFNLGSTYFEIGNYDSSIYNTNKAYEIQSEQENSVGQAYSLNIFGKIYNARKNYDTALFYFMQAANILKDRNGEVEEMTSNLIGRGNAFLGKHEFAKAEALFTEIIHDTTRNVFMEELIDSYVGLSEACEGEKKLDQALYYYKKYKELNDSIFNVENAEQVANLQQQFESEKKETQVKISEEKTETEHQMENRKQKIILGSVALVLLFVLLFAAFIFRSLRTTRKQKQLIEHQKQLVEEHRREIIDSIHYAGRIQKSLLPTEKYIERIMNKRKK